MDLFLIEVFVIGLSCYKVFTTYRQLLNTWTFLSVDESALISLIHNKCLENNTLSPAYVFVYIEIKINYD